MGVVEGEVDMVATGVEEAEAAMEAAMEAAEAVEAAATEEAGAADTVAAAGGHARLAAIPSRWGLAAMVPRMVEMGAIIAPDHRATEMTITAAAAEMDITRERDTATTIGVVTTIETALGGDVIGIAVEIEVGQEREIEGIDG